MPGTKKADAPTRAPFWSDDFDMDLLRLFPDLESRLGELAFTPIWTLGTLTQGRLNHPATWNDGFVAFWLDKPELERDDHGWCSIDGHVTDDELVEATWLEVLRDAWPHQYPIQIYGTGVLLWNPRRRWPEFERIMWNIRGWGSSAGAPATDVSADLRNVESDVVAATNRLFFKVLMPRDGL